jgi:Flp pilus assembly protein CpaB
MTSLRTDAKASMNGHGAPPVARVGAPLPLRQKRPGYAALAIVLIVGLAAVGAYFYSQAGKKVPVVVVTTDVPAGHKIQRADLSTVQVAGSVTAIGGANLNSVVGETAVVELLPNTLLQRSMVTSAPALDSSTAQVGVAVTPGQIPANGLNPGDTVDILQLPQKNTASSSSSIPAPTVLADSATVYSSTSDPSQSGGMLLTLVVPKSAAAAVAAASNAGLIALIRVGR